jgi:NTE family protein
MEIVLALGGGGSRGNSHIGVIRCLENEGFKIKAVAGSSAGGIIAACYAAGYTPDEMEEIFVNLDQSKLYGRTSGDGPSILGVDGVSKLLERLFGERKIEELNIPCAITAVDIKTAREVVIKNGNVVDAILATIALPGIFPPVERGDLLLVDGGVLNPVPVSVARTLVNDLPVVAVVLTPFFETEEKRIVGLHLPSIIPSTLVNRIQRTRIAQAFNIFLLSVDAAGRMLTELRLKMDDPEVIIRPDVGHIGLLDNVDVGEVIRLGEEAVVPHLDQLRQMSGKMRVLGRRMKRIISQ